MLNIWKNMMFPWRYPPNWIKNIKNFFRCIKWSYQRIVRGYSDYDVWDLDVYYTNIMVNSLRQLAKKHHGIPYEFEDSIDNDPDDWTIYLNKIADLLETAEQLEDEWEPDSYQANIEKAKKMRQDAFEMLLMHWRSLWD